MSGHDEPVEIQVEVVHLTEMAILIRDEENAEYWIPLSMVNEESEIGAGSLPGEAGVLVIPEWLAEEKGML